MGVVLQLGGLVKGLQFLTIKKMTCYEMLHRASDLAEGVQELGCEKNIWAYKGGSYRDFRKVHNERFRDLYSSSHIWMIKANRMTWAVQEDEGTMILQNVRLYSMIVSPPFQKSGNFIHGVLIPEIFARKGFSNAASHLPVDGRKILHCLQIG
jgi:hypothetical protein